LLEHDQFQLYCFTSACQMWEQSDKITPLILGGATSDRVSLQL